jgi:hypothetical protein
LVAALTTLDANRKLVRIAGGVLLAIVVAGVLLTDSYGYREARPAPADRIEAMKDVADHVPDRGLYLLNEWEEYGKVFMDAARVNPATEAQAPRPVALRADVGLKPTSTKRTPIFGRWFDLDRQTLGYVESFSGIITRRSPVASRPPASFRRIYSNRFYELWRRGPAVEVREHLPLQSPDRATRIPDCAKVRALASRARKGDRLVAASRPRVARLSPLEVRHPRNWPEAGDQRSTVTTRGAGVLRGSLTASGRQRVWLRASASRGLDVFVDGRRVGQARQLNTPDQWIEAGEVPLRPGTHDIEVRRPTASLRPGDSIYGYLGPVALETVGPSRLQSVPPSRASALCGRPWDWIELVAAS